MPDTIGAFNQYSISAQRHIADVLPLIESKRVVVQAGGHAGQWPIELSRHFDTVYTWEPANDDFTHLVHNLSVLGIKNVFAARGMLGSVSGTGFCTNGPSGGARRRHDLIGPCPVYRIDDLNLPVCDLIYLDTEGSELDILKGSIDTIKRCLPVIALEDRPSFNAPGTLTEYLNQYHYKPVGSHSADVFYQCIP